MKNKIESIFVILIILLSIANMKFCADAIMKLSDNTEKTYISQGEIKSKQYLVTDEYIARISPKTEVESFVMQLGLENKEIAIYEDENKEQEITEGLIRTGMIMTVTNPEEETAEETVKETVVEDTKENIDGQEEGTEEENNTEEGTETTTEETIESEEQVKEADYELSVVGDINQDGNANIVEVVQIINHLAGFEGKEIEGIELVSSDINGDEEVNLIDIDKLIRYIVFEELEIGEVGAPKEPRVEVEGTEINGWHKEDVKVSIVTEEEEFEKTVYTIDGEIFETTNKEEERTIKQNGEHKVEAYTYGTNGSKSLVTEKAIKLDKEVPVIESINKSTEEETMEAVRIEIVAKDEISGIAGYSFDGGLTWQEENYKEYTNNQEEIKIQVRDVAGNMAIVPDSIKYEIVFKNYDGTILQIENLEEGIIPKYNGETPKKQIDGYTSTFAGWDKEIEQVSGNAEYIAAFTDKVIEYNISYELNGGTVEIENPTTYNIETENFKLNNPSKADAIFLGWTLNNETEVKEEVIIEKGSTGHRTYTAKWEMLKYVAQIKETGKSYTSIEKALVEQEEGQTIILIDNVEEKVEIVENKKVILDLNGKTITNPSEEEITITNKGELTVVDNSEAKIGEIKNTIGKAIVNEANALLNMGNKEDEVSKGPYVEGETIGIESKGTFNFYDGTIRGIKAIDGAINEKTEGYNAVIGKTVDEIKQEAILGLMGEAEAKIGNNYYASLEAAIESLEETEQEVMPEEQTTITMLKNAVLEKRIDLKEYMNIKLELDGKTITSNASSEYMIRNYGRLEVIDSSESKTGEIKTTNSDSVITNMVSGKIIITEAKITGKEYGIYNRGTGNIEVMGGIIAGANSGIYNRAAGTIKIAGGTVEGNNDKYDQAYGIYNEAKGIIEISEGEVLGKNYGIYNNGAGTINVTGGKVEGNNYGIYNNGAGTINITEGTISGTVSNGKNGTAMITGGTITGSNYGILNSGTMNITGGIITETVSNSGILNIIEGTITGNSYGVYNSNSGKATITGGIITGSSYGLYNYGTINLGTKDKMVYPTSYPNENTEEVYPVIKGNSYGINNTGTFNYYDGIIFANDTFENTIYGDISEIEENYGIQYFDIQADESQGIEEEHYIMLGKDAVCRILDANGTAIKDSNGIEKTYSNLTEALKDCLNNYTIQIIRNEHVCSSSIEIAEGKTIKIDLNGCKIINWDKENLINNKGNLEILDLSESQAGEITSNGSKSIIENNGTLKISSGTISATSGNTYPIYNNSNLNIVGGIISGSGYGIYSNSGNIEITGGTITVTGSPAYGIYNNGTELIKISGGEIISTAANRYTSAYGIYNNEYGTMSVTGGTITASILSSSYTAYGVYNKGTGTITIAGGEIIGSDYGIYSNEITTIKVTDGTIKGSDYGICNGAGNIGIEGGTISGIASSCDLLDIIGGTISGRVYNNGSGAMNITRGTISGTVSNGKNGTATITGGTISGGISNSGTMSVTGGTITASGYGISNSGNLNLGTNDGTVYPSSYPNENTEEVYPVIKGNSYGINNTGTFNYYDGIIFVNNTSANAISGSINNIPNIYNENDEIIGIYDVIYKDIEANEEQGILEEHYVMLGKEAICRVINTEGNILVDTEGKEKEYYTFEKAIEDCQDGYTIQIVRTLNIKDKAEIPEGKTIKLDLNGNKVTVSNGEYLINNSGNLEILDSSETNAGLITTTASKSIIENGGTLKISSGTISNNSNGTSDSYNYIINNKGDLILAGGTISSTSEYIYSIYNIGKINMLGGTITVTGSYGSNYKYGIYNAGGTITVTGGTIEVARNYGSYNFGIYSIAGTIKITGGTIGTTGSYGSYNYGIYSGGEKIEITGGTITGGLSNAKDSVAIITRGTISGGISNSGILKIAEGTITGGLSNSKDGTITINGGSIEDGVSNTGMMTITGGTITETGTYPEGISNNGTLIITGGTIKASSYTSRNYYSAYGISNATNATIEITGGKIEATGNNGYGLVNEGTATVTRGTITGSKYGISNSGSITLGTNDKTTYPSVYPNENAEEVYPVIKGVTNGIYNEGIFNYYDGVILVDTTSANAIYGSVNATPNIYNENNEIVGIYDITYKDIELDIVEGISEKHYAILGKESICRVIDSEGNILVDTEGKEKGYYTFEKAIEDCQDEYTIQITRTLNIKDKAEIPEGKTLKIDLNGNKVTASNSECLINNAGNLEILDSSENKTGTIMSTASISIIENNGTLKISSGSISNSNNGTYDAYNYIINNKGDLTVAGGTISTIDEDYIYPIYNEGKINITGGTITGDRYNGYGVYSKGTESILISGGEIIGYDYGIYSEGTEIIKVSGGKISETSDYGIYSSASKTIEILEGEIASGINSSGAETIIISGGTISGKIESKEVKTITISGGTISGGIEDVGAEVITVTGGTISGGIISDVATINIEAGIISGYRYGVKTSGEINIKGGTITATYGNYYSYAVYGEDINISGGEITGSSYGVYNYSGTIRITGGEITGSSYGVYASGTIRITGGTVTSNNGNAIYINGGTVIIGTNDTEEPQKVPEIKSTANYGIYNNNGTINFYDGAIIGKMGAVYGKVKGVPTGYEIKSEIKTIELIEGLEVYTLAKEGTAISEASVNGIYYNTLQEAINACTNSEDVIILQRSITIEETITIAEGQTITIDLNGFTITGTIENSGTLSITNSKGTVEEGSYGTITGSGTVNI